MDIELIVQIILVAVFIDFMLLVVGAPSLIEWICNKLGI